MTPDRGDVVRASEIGRYVYCARAWWLGRVLGYRSANVSAMHHGLSEHRAHGRAVRAAERLRAAGTALVVLAALLLLVWLLARQGVG